jgi:hypothetical protein
MRGGKQRIWDRIAAILSFAHRRTQALRRLPSERTGVRVHLYALCWNDAFMLPYFFRHYDGLVDRYVMYDDGSTDDTHAILRGHPRVEVRRLVLSQPDSIVRSAQTMWNECWKESRGSADWVIITDIDEHLFHPVMAEYLRGSTESGVTLIPALGFQMVSDELPHSGELLCATRRFGAPWAEMLKPSIFDPDSIDAINFAGGRHRAAPVGRVRVPQRDEVVLLHYKYLNLARTYARQQELQRGLRPTDLLRGWGHQYSWSREQLEADWWAVRASAIDAVAFAASGAVGYPLDRWWEELRAV